MYMYQNQTAVYASRVVKGKRALCSRDIALWNSCILDEDVHVTNGCTWNTWWFVAAICLLIAGVGATAIAVLMSKNGENAYKVTGISTSSKMVFGSPGTKAQSMVRHQSTIENNLFNHLLLKKALDLQFSNFTWSMARLQGLIVAKLGQVKYPRWPLLLEIAKITKYLLPNHGVYSTLTNFTILRPCSTYNNYFSLHHTAKTITDTQHTILQ